LWFLHTCRSNPIRPPRPRPTLPCAKRPTRGSRFLLPAEAVPRRRNKAPATILLLVGPHSRHGRNRNSRTLAEAKQDNDHGPRQPKGPLAGTIAMAEQRKLWSRDGVTNQQRLMIIDNIPAPAVLSDGHDAKDSQIAVSAVCARPRQPTPRRDDR
jgi:hypothetical protein